MRLLDKPSRAPDPSLPENIVRRKLRPKARVVGRTEEAEAGNKI